MIDSPDPLLHTALNMIIKRTFFSPEANKEKPIRYKM